MWQRSAYVEMVLIDPKAGRWLRLMLASLPTSNGLNKPGPTFAKTTVDEWVINKFGNKKYINYSLSCEVFAQVYTFMSGSLSYKYMYNCTCTSSRVFLGYDLSPPCSDRPFLLLFIHCESFLIGELSAPFSFCFFVLQILMVHLASLI